MIKGIGIDLVEIERIERSMRASNRLLERILSEREYEHFNQLKSDRRKLEFVAGRFAAKEAFSKALGTGIGRLQFTDIEVLSKESGAPYLLVKGYEETRLHLSISHSQAYAIAQVIIEA